MQQTTHRHARHAEIEVGRDFADRRDMAILRLFIDSGLRRAELAHLNLADLDLDQNVVVVLGKGRRPRTCPFGRRTAIALDRYVRARATHKEAHLDALWLGQRAPVTDSGISQIVEKRGFDAGIDRLHPHQRLMSVAGATMCRRSEV